MSGELLLAAVGTTAVDRAQILIAGMAAMLITIFLGPKFIDYLRLREFGQHIREEGPQEHHAKAGTPTMGGLIIFTAITVPFLFLVLADKDPGPDRARALGVVAVALACAALGFADDYVKIIRKRSLGLRGRTKLAVTVLISIGLWAMATQAADLPSTLRLHVIDANIPVGIAYPVIIYLVLAGTTSAVNLT